MYVCMYVYIYIYIYIYIFPGQLPSCGLLPAPGRPAVAAELWLSGKGGLEYYDIV